MASEESQRDSLSSYEFRMLSYENPFIEDETFTDILKRLVSQVDKAIQRGRVMTMIYDESLKILKPGPGCEALLLDYGKFLENVPLGSGCSGLAALQKKVVIIPDVHQCELWTPIHEISATWIRSTWALPIMFKEHLFGTICIFDSQPHTPGEQDIQVVQWLVGYAATTLAAIRLKESQQKYKSLWEHNLDGICSLDVSGKFLDANPSFGKITGYTSQELKAMTYLDLLFEQDWEVAEQYLGRAFQGNPLGNVEIRIKHKNGQKVLVVYTTTPIIVHHEIVGLYVNVKDITKQKSAEEALLRSEQLSTVGELAAGFAHEIRNPLAALKGFIQLAGDATLNKKILYKKIMLDELMRIDKIVNDFLQLSKPKVNHFVKKDIRTILDDMVALLHPEAILKNIEIQFVSLPDELFVQCDENQLKQVFLNIIKNGIEAMVKGGRLLIQLEIKGKEVYIHFWDNGVGIPEEILAKIGEPFFTTKEAGTGLGLMASRIILDNHRGRFEISSASPNGTCVTVILPCLKGSMETE